MISDGLHRKVQLFNNIQRFIIKCCAGSRFAVIWQSHCYNAVRPTEWKHTGLCAKLNMILLFLHNKNNSS